MTVSKREWQQVAQWLEQEPLFSHPDKEDIEQIEQKLAHWMEREMLLIVPKEELAALKEKDERLRQKSTSKSHENLLKRVA